MGDLNELERRIKEKLSLSDERQQLQKDHFRQRMAEAEGRHRRYTAVADRLMQDVILPRMAKLKSLFDNTRMPEARNSRHNSCNSGTDSRGPIQSRQTPCRHRTRRTRRRARR